MAVADQNCTFSVSSGWAIMTAKSGYRELCEEESTIPLFLQPWWLDAVCGEDNWDVALVNKGNRIQAALPYFLSGPKRITMPQLTQTMGPWIRKSSSKYCKRLSRESSLLNGLIEQLPDFDYFHQNFHYSITNWLPFYWKGFNQTTRYTYVLDMERGLENIWGDFGNSPRSLIRRAEKLVDVVDDLDTEHFLDINEMIFLKKGQTLPFPRAYFRRLNDACISHNASKMFFAVDNEGKTHAVLYLVWTKESAYYLLSGGNPELRNSGAGYYLVWHAIQFVQNKTKIFDFEGSMLKPVEHFIRSFGARQRPYFKVVFDKQSHSPKLTKAVLAGAKRHALRLLND